VKSVLSIILTHQPAAAIAKMVDYWAEYVPREDILIAYGGPKSEFSAVQHQQRIFVDDQDLRTSDHQREFQSYTQIFRKAATFLKGREEFTHVQFMEFDHVPLARDFNQRQIERLNAEKADVLGFHLHRIDDTSHPHFLYHCAQNNFRSYWRQISRRSDSSVVLSMFGSGSFWTREAFCEVGALEEPFPMYLEIYLPTLAHHLGFRLRGFGDQERFVQVLRDATNQINMARAQGAWTLHPVKYLWN